MLSLTGCERTPVLHLTGAAQGTTYHITVVGASDEHGAALQQVIDATLARIDLSLSNYRDDSTLSHFNRAPVDSWFELDHDLAAVLRHAQHLAQQSDGAFDITVAPLLDLWGFGKQRSDVIPTEAQIDAARAVVGYRYLELDPQQSRARKRRALTIDVNGIAQGYTVDRIADVVRAAGYRNFLIELGGELRAVGHSARGDAWRVAIEQPDDANPAAVAIGNIGVAELGITTAGDYHDYFERDGVRYSHTIDPRSGRPIAHALASVTVAAPAAFEADGLDTALEVMGPEAGYAFADQHQIAAYFIVRTRAGFAVRYTRAMQAYLSEQ